MQIDDRQAKRLHYDVMGIALAIRGHMGEDALFRELDRAISALDWRKMAIAQRSFDLLSEERQRHILNEGADHDEVAGSIALFERNMRTMIPAAVPKSA